MKKEDFVTVIKAQMFHILCFHKSSSFLTHGFYYTSYINRGMILCILMQLEWEVIQVENGMYEGQLGKQFFPLPHCSTCMLPGSN